MTVSTPPRLPKPTVPDDPETLEALIEEARRRARRRRQLYGLALAAGALGTVALFGIGNRDGGGRTAEQAQPPAAPALPAPRPVTATNGRLTILAGDAIANLLPSGELRTIVLCELRRNPLCGAHPYSLDWAPDGRRLAYATAIGPGGSALDWKKYVALHVLDTQTRRHVSHRVPCFADSIDWSPDGARLAYVCGGRIYLISSDLSKPARLLRTGTPEAYLASPSWAPDGRRITFTARPRGRPSGTAPGIYVAFTAPAAPEPPVLIARGWLPAWSPDGTRIAYRSGCGGIKLVTPTGQDVTPASVVLRCSAIGVGGRPVWSPDGRKIAVSRGWPRHCPHPSDAPWNQSRAVSCLTKPGIYVMNADGTEVRLVSHQTSRNLDGGGSVTWRPRPASD